MAQIVKPLNPVLWEKQKPVLLAGTIVCKKGFCRHSNIEGCCSSL